MKEKIPETKETVYIIGGLIAKEENPNKPARQPATDIGSCSANKHVDSVGCGRGSGLKSRCCSSREPESGSQHQWLAITVIPAPGNLRSLVPKGPSIHVHKPTHR